MTKKTLKFSIVSFFYIALVLHGLQRMSGLFIIELSKGTKSITRQDAAVPFIYSWAVAKIVASLSNFLIGNKSSELVVFCGVLLCAMGTALCILDTDITTLTVFWGFIFGSGYGLASPHLTRDIPDMDLRILSFFKEIPSSFGISIMPFLLDVIILQYGLQGSFIIFTGIILQCMPFALAAAYNIEIRIPNIKWRVRKKNSHYFVSKEEAAKAVSVESFNNSLEPDFIRKVTEYDHYYHQASSDGPVNYSKETFRIGRKRSETRGNDLQGLEIGRKMLENHLTHYPSLPEVEICEENRNVAQENFSNMQATEDETEFRVLNKRSVLNSDTTHNISISDKNSINTSEYDFDSKNESLESIEQTEVGTESQKTGLDEQCIGNNTSSDKNILGSTCIQITTSLITDDEKYNNENKISEISEIEKRISVTAKQAESTSVPSNTKFLDKETTVISLESLQNSPVFTIPLDIKVHVEEYTFSVDRDCRSNSLNSNYSGDSIKNETNYLKGKFFQKNESINPSSENVHQNILKDFNGRGNLSNKHSVSKKSKFHSKSKFVKSNKTMSLNIRKDELKQKFIRVFKFFNRIISPACLCIIVITIIFETSLIALLTNIGDFVNTTDHICCDFTWILVAFGVGGLFGKICCFKISRTISEKSHTAGVVLFLLIGLSIAGVLYSPNLNWLAGFYGILGALEGGISFTMPKFISDYTHKDVHHVISSMKSFLSGVAIICLPSTLCLLPDEMGDSEFLLQTLSCLSVLCALLAYFLPYLRNISDKRNVSVFLK